MKLKPYLPENTFILNEDSLPKEHDTDRFGKIMVFRKDIGWSVISQTDAVQFLAMKHTHWTYTPDTPYD
jgi:hypothetical protein